MSLFNAIPSAGVEDGPLIFPFWPISELSSLCQWLPAKYSWESRDGDAFWLPPRFFLAINHRKSHRIYRAQALFLHIISLKTFNHSEEVK